jgi:hypothetical protein
MNQANTKQTSASTSKTKRGTVIGHEGRSIAVRYGAGVTEILLIRPCDFHVSAFCADVELRYTDHGNAGAWWHAFPVGSNNMKQNTPSTTKQTSADTPHYHSLGRQRDTSGRFRWLLQILDGSGRCIFVPTRRYNELRRANVIEYSSDGRNQPC